MKRRITKLTAILLAFVMCLSVLPTAWAAYNLPAEEDYTSAITIAVNESAVNNAGFYTATLNMDEYLANAVAAHYSRGTTAEEFKSLRFRCVLSDDLIAKCIEEGITFDANSINFVTNANINGDVFVPVDANYVAYADDYITLDYKLNPTVVDSWTTATEVKEALMAPMQMKSNAIAGIDADMIKEAKGNDGRVTTVAAVVMTVEQTQGANYGEFTSILSGQKLVGYGEYTWGVASSGSQGGGLQGVGGGDGTTAPVKKDHGIKVGSDSENGSVTTNNNKATAGDVVTIISTAEEGYRIKSLTVKTKDGRDVAVIKKDDSTYTFTMPNSEVTITAEYKEAVTAPSETGVDKILVTDKRTAYMNGYPDGDFRPNGQITRAEVCQIFYNLLINKEVTQAASFADVAQDQWFAAAINKLSEMGIINGVGNNKFEPNRAVTRAEFAAIVARFAEATRNAFDFVDVSADHWAYSYISTAAGYGWINGVGDNKFEPDRSIIRAEAATLVNRMLGRAADKEAVDAGLAKDWEDVSESFWGKYDIAEATTEHDYANTEEVAAE